MTCGKRSSGERKGLSAHYDDKGKVVQSTMIETHTDPAERGRVEGLSRPSLDLGGGWLRAAIGSLRAPGAVTRKRLTFRRSACAGGRKIVIA